MKSLSQMLAPIREELIAWWEHGEQDRPLFHAVLPSPGRDETCAPDTDDLERYWYDVDLAVQRAMWEMEHSVYYGVALPCHMPALGSAAMCAALGAQMEYVDKRTMWAHPCCQTLDEVLEITWDPNRRACHYLLEVTRRSAALSHDHHYVAPFPLEGPADILAGLYGTERLMMDMLTHPAAVQRALEHLKRIWIQAFNELQAIIATGGNEGCIGWADIWAPGTTFPMQEDNAYMVSDAVFRQFYLPHIRDIVDAMDYAMWHLDGIASARSHLDTLLSIPKLRAIQWVPDPGREEIREWIPMIRHILDAGKSVEVFCRYDEVDALVNAVGPRGLLIGVREPTHEQMEQLLERYGQAVVGV